jgi:hypothetical protein
MSPTYRMYAESARLEIDQRLRDADGERRRRLARHSVNSARRRSYARVRQLARR